MLRILHLLTAMSVLLGGCISPEITPSREEAVKIAAVHVIPMEAPPLTAFSLSEPPQSGVWIHGLETTPAGAGLVVVGSVMLLVQMARMSGHTEEASESLQSALDSGGIWMPTVALAGQARSRLASEGSQVSVDPGVKRLSGVKDRRATLFMENWMAPIRAWYNYRDPSPDHLAPNSPEGAYLLEVALINYELISDRLMLQVAMKLIDPTDGRLVGRARAANASSLAVLGPLDQAFANDAAHFKRVFSKAAGPLVEECLLSLGLLR